MKIVCIIQARTGSTRLQKKVLMKVCGKELLLHQIERILNSKEIDEVIIATTTEKGDDAIEKMVTDFAHDRVGFFRGSEDDVLDRYYQAAKKSKADVVVRVTGDCPLIDWNVLDEVVKVFLNGNFDYVANILTERTYPRGLDTEVFSFKVLEHMWKTCRKQRDREHVTTYVREHLEQFKTSNVENDGGDYSQLRWTVDEEADFELVEKIFNRLYPKNNDFTFEDVLKLLEEEPELSRINVHVEQKKNIKTDVN